MRVLFIKKVAKITKQSGTSNHWQYSYEISSENILSELDWLPLKDRFRNKKAMFAYNVKNNIKLPQSMIGKYEMKNNSNHNLRNNNTDFVLKKPKNNFMNKSITYSAALVKFGMICGQNVQKRKGLVLQNLSLFLTVAESCKYF
jgi:hypothetical protein